MGGDENNPDSGAPLADKRPSVLKSRLFRKYVALLVLIISTALVLSGAQDIWSQYREYRGTLVRLQRIQADGAATQIRQFIHEIVGQVGWTVQLPWSAASLSQRRFDALRLLRQVPAITEFVQVDVDGKEQLRVSRLAIDVIASGIDHSKDQKFREAMTNKVYYGPVYFRRESEPYMTLALAGARKQTGVAIAEVNLKFIWDVVSKIGVGKTGYAYVVDESGRLIAHPDISLVLRKTDVSSLSQVKQALLHAPEADFSILTEAESLQGKRVISAFSKVNQLGWYVFVELPRAEAFSPLQDSILRSLAYLAVALAGALMGGAWLMSRITRPIEQIRLGAAQVGTGNFGGRITVKTGDELETLADQFNDMAGRLEQSYTKLEETVEIRTRQLSQSVKELEALGKTAQVVNENLNIETVLRRITEQAAHLSDSASSFLFLPDESNKQPRLRSQWDRGVQRKGYNSDYNAELTLGLVASAISRNDAVTARMPVKQSAPKTSEYHCLAVPMRGSGTLLGCIVVCRFGFKEFDDTDSRLLRALADQSVLAVHNALLFQELEEKSRQLELASQHKSQFLANMSHELRTPLNAVLGYSELLLDGLYGEMPEKALPVLTRIQSNGTHLLGLINDVLDLSKIEAGQLDLAMGPFQITDLVSSVIASTESLAHNKKLKLLSSVSLKSTAAEGDVRRLTQVLLNLVGNALKFTDKGTVEVTAISDDLYYEISVRDTGPGISESDQQKIFGEFQQVDNSITRSKGGSGLGLAIATKIVDLHNGSLTVKSTLGEGATFTMKLPVRVEKSREAA